MSKKGSAELNVKVKTEGQKDLQGLQAEVDKLKKKLEEMGGKGGGGSKQASAGFGDMITATRLAYASVMALVAGMTTLAVKAGKFDQVAAAFKNMAASQGQDADAMLANMKRATDGMVSSVDLMVNANKAMMLGLPIERFDELMGVAKSAAESTGQSMEYMLESIVLGIGRQSRLILDNLGIIVDAEDAYAKYAATVGKSASQLTDAEKKQAFLNEALRVGKENAENAGRGTDNANKAWERFKAKVEDASISLGSSLAPAIVATLSSITDLIGALDEMGKSDTAQHWSLRAQQAFEVISFSVQSLVRNVMALIYTAGALFQGDLWGNGPDAIKKIADEAARRWEEMEAKRAQLITESNQKLADLQDNIDRIRVEKAIKNGEEIAASDRKLADKIIKEKLAAEEKKNRQILAGEEATRLKREKAEAIEGEKALTFAKKHKQALDSEMTQLDKEYAREKTRLSEDWNGKDSERLLEKLERDLLEAKRIEVIRAEETLRLRENLTNEEKQLMLDLQKEQSRIDTEIADKKIAEAKRAQKEINDGLMKGAANPFDPEASIEGSAIGVANAAVEGKEGARRIIVQGEVAGINAVTQSQLGTALEPLLEAATYGPKYVSDILLEFADAYPEIMANQLATLVMLVFDLSFASKMQKTFLKAFSRITADDYREMAAENEKAWKDNWKSIAGYWDSDVSPQIKKAGSDLNQEVIKIPQNLVDAMSEAFKTFSTDTVKMWGEKWNAEFSNQTRDWGEKMHAVGAEWDEKARDFGAHLNDELNNLIGFIGDFGVQMADTVLNPVKSIIAQLGLSGIDFNMAANNASLSVMNAADHLWNSIVSGADNLWRNVTDAGREFWARVNPGGGDTGIKGGKGWGDAIGVDTSTIGGQGADVPVQTSLSLAANNGALSSGSSSSSSRASSAAPSRTGGGGGGQTVISLTVNGGMLGSAQEARTFVRAIDRELMRLRRDKESLAFDSSL